MMSLSSFAVLVSFVLLLVARSASAQAQLSSDFAINVTSVDDVVFTGLRNLPDSPSGKTKITFANLAAFPVLAGQGLSGAVLKFGPNSINTLHSHPRGSELFFVISGSLVAGLIDSNKKLYTKTLHAGDVILFPIGLKHFQLNTANEPATALAAFSNPNAGRVSDTPTIFNTDPRIDAGFLERVFTLDETTVERLLATTFPQVDQVDQVDQVGYENLSQL